MIAGAHLNPAITGAFALLGRIGWKKVLVYWIAQYVGALFGAFFVYAVYKGEFHDTQRLTLSTAI